MADQQFPDCISKVISRLYPGTREQEGQIQEWIMSREEVPSLDVRLWLRDITNRQIEEIDYGLLKDIFHMSIAAFHKEFCSRTIGLPGYGYPVDWVPSPRKCFPSIMGERGVERPSPALLLREICMLKVVEDITNKPGWWHTVRLNQTANMFKETMLKLEWTNYMKYADFTPSMADACISELRHKASLYKKTGLIPVLDYYACVLKSDKLIPDSLKQELIAGTSKLESNYSNIISCGDLVLDLIDPSLYPLVYDRSRILPDRTISLANCLEACGNGDVIAVPFDETDCSDVTYPNTVTSLSFQWLPCDVDIDGGGNAKIVSYINNLHPSEDANMYSAIEHFITIALPAWDVVYKWPKQYSFQRLNCVGASHYCHTADICGDNSCSPGNMPLETEESHDADSGNLDDSSLNAAERYEDEDVYFPYEESENTYWYGHSHPASRRRVLEQWFSNTHPLVLEVLKHKNANFRLRASDVRRASFFAHGNRRVQVIVKLTSIRLTPDNPDYKGGTWGLDGQLNEHIVSTARFYCDSDNITKSHLYFRSIVDKKDINSVPGPVLEDDYLTMERVFGVSPRTSMFQDIGRVCIRPGGTIFSSNLYQHRDGPFSLVDRSRPGYRKVLTLYLVDPAITVISTANVPPQQKHWWTKSKAHHQGLKMAEMLPPELRRMVHNYVDMPIDHAEAEKIRKELLEDRAMLKGELYNELKGWRWDYVYA